MTHSSSWTTAKVRQERNGLLDWSSAHVPKKTKRFRMKCFGLEVHRGDPGPTEILCGCHHIFYGCTHWMLFLEQMKSGKVTKRFGTGEWSKFLKSGLMMMKLMTLQKEKTVMLLLQENVQVARRQVWQARKSTLMMLILLTLQKEKTVVLLLQQNVQVARRQVCQARKSPLPILLQHPKHLMPVARKEDGHRRRRLIKRSVRIQRIKKHLMPVARKEDGHRRRRLIKRSVRIQRIKKRKIPRESQK